MMAADFLALRVERRGVSFLFSHFQEWAVGGASAFASSFMGFFCTREKSSKLFCAIAAS